MNESWKVSDAQRRPYREPNESLLRFQNGTNTPIQNLTPRYREAKRVATKVKQKYGSEKVTAIGHSLGGGLAANSGIQKRITYNKAVGLSDLCCSVSSGQIDYRTKKDPVSFLSYFQRYKKGAKKVQFNR